MLETIKYIKEAIKLAHKNLKTNDGWPFGAVIVKDWKIIGRWRNMVISHSDPTAHAEVQAIRNACKKLWEHHLDWCEIYTSCEPCPMCLWAIYRAHISKIYYADTQEDAAKIGFDDNFIYEELSTPKSKRKIPMKQINHKEALKVFQKWTNKKDKEIY